MHFWLLHQNVVNIPSLPSLPSQETIVSCNARGCQKATPCGLHVVLSLGVLGILSFVKGLKRSTKQYPPPSPTIWYWFDSLFKKDLSMYLRERTSRGRGRRRERENLQADSLLSVEPRHMLISWDHKLNRNQESEVQPTVTPRCPQEALTVVEMMMTKH